MNRYKARWIYGPQTNRRGQIAAECEADSLPEFAEALCTTYAYDLGDNFNCMSWDSAKEIQDCYGDNLPNWVNSITCYPVHCFSSAFGEEIVCGNTAIEIINQIRNEGYGDCDLRITGV